MPIVVYSKPACPQCAATYRYLRKHNLPFEVVDMSTDAEALDLVKGLGYQQAPVVFANGEHWSGFRPDRLRSLRDRNTQSDTTLKEAA